MRDDVHCLDLTLLLSSGEWFLHLFVLYKNLDEAETLRSYIHSAGKEGTCLL
jgi:hypothetical protein